MWEAMHGDMAGYYEVRVRAGKDLFRLFVCWTIMVQG